MCKTFILIVCITFKLRLLSQAGDGAFYEWK